MGFFDDFVLGIVGTVQNTITGVDDFLTDFNPLSFVDEMAQAVASLGARFYSAVMGYAALFANALKEIANSIVSATTTMATYLYSAIQYLAYALNQAISDIARNIGAFGNWLFNAAAELASMMATTVSSIFSFLSSWANQIYLSFSLAISVAAVELETHLAQFATGVMDKFQTMLAVNTAMAIIKHDISTPGFNPLKTGAKAFGGMILADILGGMLRSLI
jgi:phage-related minor tail protein